MAYPFQFNTLYINQALKLVETAAYTREELLAYDKSWDAISSEKTLMADRYNKGLTEGRAEGIAKVAINMDRLGFSPEQIFEATGLTQEQIKE